MGKRKTKVAYLGILTALALVFSYVEMLLPPIYTAVPGIKMGLPNIVIVLALYCLGFKYAAIISLVRVFAVFLLFGNAMTVIYSLVGAILSLLLMFLLKKSEKFSCVGVSVAGAVMHNLGQTLVAMLLLETAEIGYYMIVLTITGTIAGALIGLVSAQLTKRLENRFK